jgi:hypothetical protein
MRSSKSWLGLLGIIVLLTGAVLTACGGDDDSDAEATPAAAASLFVAADMVQGGHNVPEGGSSCVLNSQFPRNSEMVWRVRISDPQTGDLMGDDSIDSVVINLSNGESIEMGYGPHPRQPPQTFYWTASWVVPVDSPTGTLDYEVVATATDGRTGSWEPFAVQASLPTITDEVLEEIEE